MENPISEQTPPTSHDLVSQARLLGQMIIKRINTLPWAQKLTKKQLDIAIYTIYGVLIFIYLKYLLTYGIHRPFLWTRYFWESLVIIAGSVWVLVYWHGQGK